MSSVDVIGECWKLFFFLWSFFIFMANISMLRKGMGVLRPLPVSCNDPTHSCVYKFSILHETVCEVMDWGQSFREGFRRWRCSLSGFISEYLRSSFFHLLCPNIVIEFRYRVLVKFLTYGLWNSEIQCCIHEGSPIIPILNRINQMPRIHTHFFKSHYNIGLPFTPRPF